MVATLVFICTFSPRRRPVGGPLSGVVGALVSRDERQQPTSPTPAVIQGERDRQRHHLFTVDISVNEWRDAVAATLLPLPHVNI